MVALMIIFLFSLSGECEKCERALSLSLISGKRNKNCERISSLGKIGAINIEIASNRSEHAPLLGKI